MYIVLPTNFATKGDLWMRFQGMTSSVLFDAIHAIQEPSTELLPGRIRSESAGRIP